jgi:hypothetical protein
MRRDEVATASYPCRRLGCIPLTRPPANSYIVDVRAANHAHSSHPLGSTLALVEGVDILAMGQANLGRVLVVDLYRAPWTSTDASQAHHRPLLHSYRFDRISCFGCYSYMVLYVAAEPCPGPLPT